MPQCPHNYGTKLKYIHTALERHVHTHTHNSPALLNSSPQPANCTHPQTHRRAVIKWRHTETHHCCITLTALSITISHSCIHVCRHAHAHTKQTLSLSSYIAHIEEYSMWANICTCKTTRQITSITELRYT